jgi:hypothetical protein
VAPLLHLDSYSTAAELVAAVVADNANWNNAGIPERDVGTCLQMSRLCDWGSDYRPAMLREALRELAPSRFKKSGDRWHHIGTRQLDTFTRDLPEARVCDGPLCDRDITGKRVGTRFCSVKCRMAASRRAA